MRTNLFPYQEEGKEKIIVHMSLGFPLKDSPAKLPEGSYCIFCQRGNFTFLTVTFLSENQHYLI